MKPVTITYDLLKSKGTCENILSNLKSSYGDSKTFNDPQELADVLSGLHAHSIYWCEENLIKNKDAYKAAEKLH